jgi:hypothetical protein
MYKGTSNNDKTKVPIPCPSRHCINLKIWRNMILRIANKIITEKIIKPILNFLNYCSENFLIFSKYNPT